MQNDLKTAKNRSPKSLAFKLRNQLQEISLTRGARTELQANISAAC